MKLKFEELSISSKKDEELIDITDYIKSLIKKHKILNGFCKIFVLHTTAAVTINENTDENVKTDILNQLKRVFPKINFHHLEGNSDAHLKSSLFGCSIDIPIYNGELILGTWQGIYFCEFDGPRKRKIFIQLYYIDDF